MRITIGSITATFWVWVVIISGSVSAACFILSLVLKWLRR